MANIIMITGGGRCGKSAYAQRMAESFAGRRLYIATCPPLDEEMKERIRRHREERAASNWETIEETTDIVHAMRRAKNCDVILVDCLTLWVNNLLYESETKGAEFTEEDMVVRCGEVLDACARRKGTVIFVTSEVGMGIIPGDLLSRRFRDLMGRCNQTMASSAAAVILMISGIPMKIKGELPV